MEKYIVIANKILVGISSVVGFTNERQYKKRKHLITGDHSKCYVKDENGSKQFNPEVEFQVVIPFEFKENEEFFSADVLPKTMAQLLITEKQKKEPEEKQPTKRGRPKNK